MPTLKPLLLLRWLAPPALVAVVAVGACYAVPSAEIVIVPRAEPFSRTVTVRVDPVAETVDIDLGILPGVTVRRTVITVLATETTGSIRSATSTPLWNSCSRTMAMSLSAWPRRRAS